ncbi:hypothetical protein BJ138DRAFT_685912 [Hygrophoropsis aurantiaca]|uniref:Uncharacterized protein n=1 Tax=Hygrophoropsis aurantiaca TaxID=72124 RepID=A0ACB8ARX9_9AGAM|nr:hypothetical protein BJ138DRAFT_685912 [Hygrophoropsis aurantiaca]
MVITNCRPLQNMKNARQAVLVQEDRLKRQPVVLPSELLLREIFPKLPLKSLIAARGVTKQWRYLVPFASLLPARRALLDLYYFIIKSPSFLASRSHIQKHLRKFDRGCYLGLLQLLVQDSPGCSVPEEVRLWILEWPNSAAFLWTWPGLSPGRDYLPMYKSGMRRFWRRVRLKNCFSDSDGFPALSGIFMAHSGQSPALLQMIEIWEHRTVMRHADWLVVDTEPDDNGCTHFGEVYYCDGSRTNTLIASSWSDWVKLRIEQEDCRARQGWRGKGSKVACIARFNVILENFRRYLTIDKE